MAVFRILMNVSAIMLWYCGSQRKYQKRVFDFSRIISQIIKRIFGTRTPGYPSYEAQIFNSLITRLNKICPGLPLEKIVKNDLLISEALYDKKGVIIATVHTQLTLALHSICDDMGRPPIFVGKKFDDMTGWNWSTLQPVESLDSKNSSVLIHIRSALKSGRIVVSFVDFHDTEKGPLYICPNLFSFSHLIKSPMIYMMCALNENGRIRINLSAEPTDLARPSDKARAFSKFIETQSGVRLDIRRPRKSHSGFK